MATSMHNNLAIKNHKGPHVQRSIRVHCNNPKLCWGHASQAISHSKCIAWIYTSLLHQCWADLHISEDSSIGTRIW